jgi:hypothetical protein
MKKGGSSSSARDIPTGSEWPKSAISNRIRGTMYRLNVKSCQPQFIYKHTSVFLFNACTANEGPVRIQYIFLVPISVFPEMKLCTASLFPQQNYNVLPPNSYTHISMRDLYISRIGLSI